jgi:hypothetical protein
LYPGAGLLSMRELEKVAKRTAPPLNGRDAVRVHAERRRPAQRAKPPP